MIRKYDLLVVLLILKIYITTCKWVVFFPTPHHVYLELVTVNLF